MNPVILLTSIFALIIGLAVTFFGERIFKISLTSTGFAVGAVLAGGILFNFSENIFIAMVGAAIAGFITSLLVRSAYRTGLFVIGFAMSSIIATYIAIAMDAVSVNIQNIENIDPNTIQQLLPLILAGFAMSMVSGSLIVLFDTPILRVATAIFGAIVFSISGFVLTTGMESLPQSTASLVSVQLFVWGAIWIPLAIAGVVFQFFGVNWLFRLLQIDQGSRQENARRKAYYQQKQQVQRPPNQQTPPQQGYPQNPQQRPPSSGQANPQGYPPQRPSAGQPSQQGYPPKRQPPQRRKP